MPESGNVPPIEARVQSASRSPQVKPRTSGFAWLPSGDLSSLPVETARGSLSGLPLLPEPRPNRCKACMKSFVESRPFSALVTIATIYALFGDDLRLWLTTRESDEGFFAASAVTFVLFSVEIVMYSIIEPRYACPPSFFFWLDLFATLSLVPDIGWVWDPLLLAFDPAAGSNNIALGGDFSAQVRAGRAARAGARAGRIVRILRLVRLVRVFKLYNQAYRTRARREKEQETAERAAAKVAPEPQSLARVPFSSSGRTRATQQAVSSSGSTLGRDSESSLKPPPKPVEQDEDELLNPVADGTISKVGMVLSDLTTRRVILLILVMLFVVPFLGGADLSPIEQQRGGLAQLHRFPQDWNVSVADFRFSVQEYARSAGRVVYLGVCSGSHTGCKHEWPSATLHTWLSALRFDPLTGDAPQYPNGTRDDRPTAGIGTHPSTQWSSTLLANSETELLAKYRNEEVYSLSLSKCFGEDAQGRTALNSSRGTCESVVWFDAAPTSKREAMFSFVRTWFVIVIISAGAALFTRDAELLVIRPIERMTSLMTKLATNPLAEIQAIRNAVLNEAEDSEDESRRSNDDDEDDNDRGFHAVTNKPVKQAWWASTPEGTSRRPLESDRSKIEVDAQVKPTTATSTSLVGPVVPSLPLSGPQSPPAPRLHQMTGRSSSAQDIRNKKRTALGQLASRREILHESMAVATAQLSMPPQRRARSSLPGSARSVGLSKRLIRDESPKARRPTKRHAKHSTAAGVKQCAASTGSFVCTSLVNLIGGSAEDASRQAEGSYETAKLENAMIKIGGLLQVGFGEAGADIIAKNMGTGKLDPLIPGKRVDAIFGFCDIRRFTDATECLQEDVMVFVNTVGHLVHSATHRLGGAANKNIGDAFLLTWKLPQLLDPALAGQKRHDLLIAASKAATDQVGRRDSIEAFSKRFQNDPELFEVASGRRASHRGDSSAASSHPPSPLHPPPLAVLSSNSDGQETPSMPPSVLPPVEHPSADVDLTDTTAAGAAAVSSEGSVAQPTQLVDMASPGDIQGRNSALQSAESSGPAVDADAKQSVQPAGELSPRSAVLHSMSEADATIHGLPSAGSEINVRRPSVPVRSKMGRKSIVGLSEGKTHQYEHNVTIVGGDRGARGSETMRMRDRMAVARVADNALAAFLKVIVDVHNANRRGGSLYRFRADRRIRDTLDDGFRVELGFGLHLGWAVEGAVGSSYKIDASYLSPHVNLASRLEALTKFYGVPLLMSGNFAQELSMDAQRFLRLIDRVTVKGSKVPVELYTFDIVRVPETFGEDVENLEPRTLEQLERNRFSQEPMINIDFESDVGVLFLQEGLEDAFFDKFHAGVRAYIRGEWDTARDLVIEAQTRYRPGGDGPTKALLHTMDKLGAGPDKLAPPDWKGVHVLDSKTG
jgi:class 3 adenylate cyclase